MELKDYDVTIDYNNPETMTIPSLVCMYSANGEPVCSENSVGVRALPLDIILKNKEFARNGLMQKSKEELVDYILNPLGDNKLETIGFFYEENKERN